MDKENDMTMQKLMKKKGARGFTLIELMIVVAIIGILAAIAIPNFLRYQLRARRSEGSVNVAAIRTAQLSYFGTNDSFVETEANPPNVTWGTRADWDRSVEGWRDLAFEPEGSVYFQYLTVGGEDDQRQAFFASAISDLDSDGSEFSCWLFIKPHSGSTPPTFGQIPGECDSSGGAGGSGGGAYKLNQVYLATPEGQF